jgi:hypothetical protein
MGVGKSAQRFDGFAVEAFLEFDSLRFSAPKKCRNLLGCQSLHSFALSVGSADYGLSPMRLPAISVDSIFYTCKNPSACIRPTARRLSAV